MAQKKQKLMIIDGNALIHRSFHALPPTMQTRAGETTNAVYGFVTVLLKAIRDLKPDYIALTLDRKAPTFRHQEFEAYKATRVKAPDELYAQIPRVREVAQAFGIPIYELDGYEADDLIGTITKKVDGKVEKIVVTGDMDTLQLINPHTRVYTMSRGLSDSVIYDDDAVYEKYGLSVDQMIDYKALRGDPSDNIPGVRGIGEKTATDLLKEFKTLDKLYSYLEKTPEEKIDKIKPRIVGLLKENKDNAYLSYRLATINLNAPIKFDLAEARFGDFDMNKVVELFSELEFKSLLARVRELGIKAASKKSDSTSEEFKIDKFERNRQEFKYIFVDDEKKFNLFLAELKKQKEFSFDTETTGFDPLTCGLLGVSFSWHEGSAYYLKIRINKDIVSKKVQKNLFNNNPDETNINIAHPWLLKLKPILEDEKIKKCAQNAKFDIRVMRSFGIEIRGLEFDTMIASYILNPGTRQHNLDALAFTELGFEKISKDDLLGTGKNKISFVEVPDDRLALYSSEDADFTFRLKNKLSKQIKKEKQEKLFSELEMPLVLVLSRMEDNGIKLDEKILNKLKEKVSDKIRKLEKKIYKLSGTKFNIDSPKQLKEVLFETMEISTAGVGKTKSGFSTAADELDKLKDEHEIIPLIQEYRELRKLLTTYIESLPELVNKKDGRLHTCFNQTITATGRLSSTEPNLQNIPIRTALGREIRQAFIADKGYKLVSFDYSQIELRLAAHMSGDKSMINAFKNNIDIHTATAAAINEVDLKDVTKEMRREAKATNFGILYGQGPYGLSQNAGISFARAKEFIDNYFSVYSGIKKYIESSIDEARENGYAETLFGRRRYLPEINSSVAVIQKNAERMAINTPLQGTAADIIKVAMAQIDEKISGHQEIKMLLQVHDELLFEIKEGDVEKWQEIIKNIMEGVLKLKVPLLVDISVGNNWGEL